MSTNGGSRAGEHGDGGVTSQQWERLVGPITTVREPQELFPDETLEQALRRLILYGRGGLPVLSADRETLQGWITNGIRLPIRLTHTVLAELIAARRPTVSTALAELTQRGLIDHVGKAWLLRGDPPRELLEVRPVAVADPESRTGG